ncbi:hypothetical protein Lalb_Chr09g0321991 [Lupinus albus]|uniref:Uncharacterized protein n=1 Tax=Lupinus albus TaxID=3870 RepID=A0A6A4PZH6_LUPAL|nr:hypothetical protein Lalb_Chr09g0321991 [Lupinus albus]
MKQLENIPWLFSPNDISLVSFSFRITLLKESRSTSDYEWNDIAAAIIITFIC